MTLEIQNLSFGYSNNPVFQDICLSVGSHEILCLLGANGAGKTTFFKVLLGLYACTSGHVFLDGRDISKWTRSKIAHYVGYVPQNHVPPFPFSVTDVVLMGRTAHLRAYQSPTRIDVRIAIEAMQKLEIEHLKDRSYTEISGGERQLVMIARALAQEPKILVMDEPTLNLDFGNQVRILKYLKQLADSGLAIIFTTHYPDHALQFATKVALMKDGRLGTIGDPDKAITGERELHTIAYVNSSPLAVDREGRESN